MALYVERRRHTALVYLDAAGGMYRRSDVLSMLETTVGLRKVEAVGQLQNNCSWEVVFRDEDEHAIQGRRSHRSWGVMTPHFSRQRGTGDKVNVENTKMTTENISISVSRLQIKQRN